MYNELNETLSTLVSPERLAVIKESRELLQRLGLTAVEDELQQILEISASGDGNELVSRVAGLLYQVITDSLREMGITVKPEAPLEVVKDLLMGLILTEHSTLPEDLVSLLEGDYDNEELIATLVSQMTNLTLFDILDYIDTVSENLPKAIRDRAMEQLELLPPQEDNPIREAKLQTIRRMRYLTQGEHPREVLRLSQNGVRLGAPISLLVEFALESLEPLSNETLGKELLGLVIYSNTAMDQTAVITEETIVDFIGDLKDAQRAVQGARELWYQLEEQTCVSINDSIS